MTATSTPGERAAAGAAYLDHHRPGWSVNIDLDRLNMSDFRTCILGQMYGHYADGRNAIAPTGWDSYDDQVCWAKAHGFQARDPWGTWEYIELTDAWSDQVRARRG